MRWRATERCVSASHQGERHPLEFSFVDILLFIECRRSQAGTATAGPPGAAALLLFLAARTAGGFNQIRHTG